jgi:hypothetical protein
VRGRDKLRCRVDNEKRSKEKAQDELRSVERKLKRQRWQTSKARADAERERERRRDAENDTCTLVRGEGVGGTALTRIGRAVQDTIVQNSDEMKRTQAEAAKAKGEKRRLEVAVGRVGRELVCSKESEQAAVQQAEEERAKKTVAQTRLENEERKRKAAEAEVGNAKKARATAESKRATAEAEVARMAEELGEMDVEVDELRDELFRARSLMPKVAQAQSSGHAPSRIEGDRHQIHGLHGLAHRRVGKEGRDVLAGRDRVRDGADGEGTNGTTGE